MQTAPIQGIDSRTFRTTMGSFATGVTVVSTHHAGKIHAMTANAFISVSLEPPLVLVSIGQKARMHSMLVLGMPLGISILGEHQRALSDHFAGRASNAAPTWNWEDDTPLLGQAVGHVAGRVVALHPAGDHSLVIAHVTYVANSDHLPLVFHNGQYTALQQA
jgi:flavin reductase (DIM6/NTAB) family NADH-FMN oxidoreductase RutF